MSIKSMAIIQVGMIALLSSCHQSVTFRSEESLTLEGHPVYNEVTLVQDSEVDTWMMRQSHAGPSLSKSKWDLLAIKVNRDTREVKFYQLKSGEMYFNKKNEIPLKVSCFYCHSNGPRAIRPHPISKLSATERLNIISLNIKIKLYGPLKTVDHSRPGKVPLRGSGLIENEVLKLTRCTSCHNREDAFGRGQLTRQNSLTISHLLQKQHMPPIGKLTDAEREYLNRFMQGF